MSKPDFLGDKGAITHSEQPKQLQTEKQVIERFRVLLLKELKHHTEVEDKTSLTCTLDYLAEHIAPKLLPEVQALERAAMERVLKEIDDEMHASEDSQWLYVDYDWWQKKMGRI